jgi:TRAP-type C4-dicarboxylate transport system permease small subunit
MMALALGATSLLLHGMVDATPPRTRRWLRLLVAVNILIALACLVAAGWLVLRV